MNKDHQRDGQQELLEAKGLLADVHRDAERIIWLVERRGQDALPALVNILGCILDQGRAMAISDFSHAMMKMSRDLDKQMAARPDPFGRMNDEPEERAGQAAPESSQKIPDDYRLRRSDFMVGDGPHKGTDPRLNEQWQNTVIRKARELKRHNRPVEGWDRELVRLAYDLAKERKAARLLDKVADFNRGQQMLQEARVEAGASGLLVEQDPIMLDKIEQRFDRIAKLPEAKQKARPSVQHEASRMLGDFLDATIDPGNDFMLRCELSRLASRAHVELELLEQLAAGESDSLTNELTERLDDALSERLHFVSSPRDYNPAQSSLWMVHRHLGARAVDRRIPALRDLFKRKKYRWAKVDTPHDALLKLPVERLISLAELIQQPKEKL